MLSQSVYKIDYKTMLLVLLLIAAVMLLPELGFAQGAGAGGAGAGGAAAPVTRNDALDTNREGLVRTICSALDELRGPVARGLAAIGIVFLGFSLFLGKISWGIALALAIGIGAVFGAPQIVSVLGDGEEACPEA